MRGIVYELKKLASEASAVEQVGQFVLMDPADYLCPEGRCSVVTENKKLLHVDESGHLSKYGAGILAQKIVTELRRPIRPTSTSLR